MRPEEACAPGDQATCHAHTRSVMVTAVSIRPSL
jgi:hypothetical protein